MIFVGFDPVLPVPPVVWFWASYEQLYGGPHEERIARRNGYPNAEAMRLAKFDEWKREQGMSEERADGHYWIVRRYGESCPWSTVPEIAELRTHEAHDVCGLHVPTWRGWHRIGGDVLTDLSELVRVLSGPLVPPSPHVSASESGAMWITLLSVPVADIRAARDLRKKLDEIKAEGARLEEERQAHFGLYEAARKAMAANPCEETARAYLAASAKTDIYERMGQCDDRRRACLNDMAAAQRRILSELGCRVTEDDWRSI